MNAEISETIRARLLGFGMQIPELLAQRNLIRQDATPTLTPTNLPKGGSYSFDTYRLTQKKVCHAHPNSHNA